MALDPKKVGMALMRHRPYTLADFPQTAPKPSLASGMLSRCLQPIPSKIVLCLAALSCLSQSGCVRRRLMVRSSPPGAMVYVDNQPIGNTPCATDFTYYGTREIRLVKAGYETLTVNQPLPAPWYQIPPLDFVSENVVPRKIQDYRTASYNLVPQVIVPTEQLIARGEQLRQSTLQGTTAPTHTGATPIPVLPPGTSTGQPALVQPSLGQPTLMSPAGTAPGPIVPPVAPGTGALPYGGQPIEVLPPSQQ